MAVLFEFEGLLTIPCQAPGLLETSLSSSALCSLPGADITQAACGERWLRGQRPKCAQCGVWHHPAASARTPCLCQDPLSVPGTDAEAEAVWAVTAVSQGTELRFSEKGACDDAQRAVGHPWYSGQLRVPQLPMENGDSQHTCS